jgi:hypothetical protein
LLINNRIVKLIDHPVTTARMEAGRQLVAQHRQGYLRTELLPNLLHGSI